MKLLITGAWNASAEQLSTLQALGCDVIRMPDERGALPCPPDWVEGVICNGLFLYHAIEQFENLRYIQLTSAGYDRVPLPYIQKKGIELHNARGVYSAPMAEYAIGGVLQLYKKAAFFRENQQQHRWEKHRGLQELTGKTVCIVGCGDVGTACAKRFAAFDARVIGIGRTVRELPWFEEILPMEQLDAALEESDVVVLALPLTEETRGLFDAARIRRIKAGAVLVNIARGALVDTEAMTEALRSGHLSGAVLDVFDREPLPPESPLWDMENVILTPHNSFVGERIKDRLANVICRNLEV